MPEPISSITYARSSLFLNFVIRENSKKFFVYLFFIICSLVPETPISHACRGSFYTFQHVCKLINNFNFFQQKKLSFRNGAIKTITYGRMYIANGKTVKTRNVIETAGGKKLPGGHRKKLFGFLCITIQSSLKPILTAELGCSCQSKDSLLEQKIECKEEDKIFELNES